jgi:hypothetical protein
MDETIRMKLSYKDTFIPSVVLIFLTAFVFIGFYMVKSVNGNLICQIADVAGEETDPSIGRLICCLLYFSLSVALVVIAERRWAADSEKLLLTWSLSALGGTMLWTSVGECSWHFGLNVMSDEGTEIFASFPRIESVQGLPFFILSILIFAACYKKMSFPLASYVFAFLGNWYGHLCMIAAYPIAKTIGINMELGTFYKVSALINALIIAVIGVFLIAGKTKRTTKYMAAVCMYVALGNVLFGIIMGET